MCNAHNHSKYCNCGFSGGNRYKSYVLNTCSQINYSYEVLKYFPTSSFSLTIPNALCPVCNNLVFFYQNIYGSRVYFDILGPPWTKHPCTDSSKFSYNKALKNIDIYSPTKNLIPENSANKIKDFNVNQSVNKKWIPISNKEFNFISNYVVEINSNEYYCSKFDFLHDDFIFLQYLTEDEFLISSYNVNYDYIRESKLISKRKCLGTKYEQHFIIRDLDIFYVMYMEDLLFNTKVCTVNRPYNEYYMKTSQFSEETKRKLLFDKDKNFGKIKVQIRKGKLYEI